MVVISWLTAGQCVAVLGQVVINVAVSVDEVRRQSEPDGIDDLDSRGRLLADGGDGIAFNMDFYKAGWPALAIQNRRAHDDETLGRRLRRRARNEKQTDE